MKDLDSKRLLDSAKRLARGEGNWKESHDTIWLPFLKRETRILLRRSFRAWWRVKFREGFMKWFMSYFRR